MVRVSREQKGIWQRGDENSEGAVIKNRTEEGTGEIKNRAHIEKNKSPQLHNN